MTKHFYLFQQRTIFEKNIVRQVGQVGQIKQVWQAANNKKNTVSNRNSVSEHKKNAER